VHSESLNNVTLPGSARQRTLLREGPLVSVIIPTYNRPTLLDYALESVQRQTYRNIETIVVIDGGPTLEMLASKYPNVRFLHMAVNDSVTSCNTAFTQSNGEYIAFLNDDDLFLPDHVAELVTALERSGEAVAHGDVLTAFLRGNDEEWLLYGFESNMSRVVELTSILVSNQIGMTSCMFRHDCIQDGTPFEEAVPLYRDYALWLRLASEFTFVHVERITSCYTIRNSGTQQQSTLWYDKALRSYEVLYRQYPIQGRPLIDRRRREVLQSVTSGHMGIATARPAGDVHEVVWPLWKPGLGKNPGI
jgi:glycosyltransferase involved in cell wall biosynthesis